MITRAPQIELRVAGAYFDERTPFEDERGLFMEIEHWDVPNPELYSFHQLNYSVSKYGVIRGMHVQSTNPQGKLVTCLKGELLDVVHDLRKQSHTYGVTDYWILKPGQSLFSPPGTAHGFQCLTKTCEIVYLCTSVYLKEFDTGFHWEDAKAPWQKEPAIVSKKDQGLPRLAELIRSHEWMS
jgi:dTDP-4-dehydrorhamnose 3,5-epimerase